MMLPPLPTELIDAILSDLKYDRATLATCSVVSHQWLVSARRCIFERCIFKGTSRDGELGLQSAYHQKLTSFQEFLDRAPYVGPFIKTFELCCEFLEPTQQELEREKEGAAAQEDENNNTGKRKKKKKRRIRSQEPVYHIDAGLLLQVLAKMPTLETLEFWQVCITKPAAAPCADHPGPPPPAALAPTPNTVIIRLGMHWVPAHATDLADVSYIFELFPKVNDVHVFDCTFGRPHLLSRDPDINEYILGDQSESMISLPRSTRLEILRLGASLTPPLLLAALKTETVDSLKRLDVQIPAGFRTLDDMFHIKRLVKAAGSSLEDIEIKYEWLFDKRVPYEVHALHFDGLLAPCTRLETLYFHLPFEEDFDADRPWTHFTHALRDVGSPAMHSIKLAVYRPNARYQPLPPVKFWKNTVPWAALREGLCRAGLRTVKEVRVVEEYEVLNEDRTGTGEWNERPLAEDVQALLREELAELLVRDVLTFQV